MNQTIDIHYQTLALPPPYSYAYTLRIALTAQRVKVKLAWHYTDRDELSEEEIREEGFTPDDDIRWQGTLPAVWAPALRELLDQTRWLAEETVPSGDSRLAVTVTDAQGKVTTGTPADAQRWEYQLQELIQGIYEAGKREHPLRLRYLDLTPNSPVKATLDASFMHRRFAVTTEQGSWTYSHVLPWQKLPPLLEALYLPDYHTELSESALPHKPGQYVDPGDGLWYPLGKAVVNPGKTDAVGTLRKIMKDIVLIA